MVLRYQRALCVTLWCCLFACFELLYPACSALCFLQNARRRFCISFWDASYAAFSGLLLMQVCGYADSRVTFMLRCVYACVCTSSSRRYYA